jgi:Rps23 Pro-64 3,4-dihydroxylase Tpa1-like proline 4-hydroxylase
MKVTSESNDFLVIDDFYTEDEQINIWKELDFLTYDRKLMPPEETGTAHDQTTGEALKKNSALFLDRLYARRELSNILNINRKLFSQEIIDEFNGMDNCFKYIHHTNYDATLISYYEEKDYYKAHTDSSILTYLYWCHKEPKKFEGGDLILPELDEGITYKNNRLVIFPSWRLHEVTPIKMIEEVEPYSGYGRYCITNFVYIK